MRVLILGITGMLGSSLFEQMSEKFDTWGTARSSQAKKFFPNQLHEKIIYGLDVLDSDELVKILGKVKPDVVINAIGLIKQLEAVDDPLLVLPINAMFPHKLTRLCTLFGARVVHISTDCVFSGVKGDYVESDISDAHDLYGKSKFIGELHSYDNAITLRTSIIGHGITPNTSLIDWFLAQNDMVQGYSKAIFSGLPTVELAHVISDYVLPNNKLSGLYHVSAEAIDKNTLLNLVAKTYKKDIKIVPNTEVAINRALNSEYFKSVTGYRPPAWTELIEIMYENKKNRGVYV